MSPNNTKIKILVTGKKIIEKQGVVAFNFADIAKLANISSGTLYKYFHKKEDLFVYLFTGKIRSYIACLEEVKNSPLTPLEKLVSRHLVLITIAYHQDPKDPFNYVFSNYSLWMNAEDNLLVTMKQTFIELNTLLLEPWHHDLRPALLSSDEFIEDLRNRLLCFQRGACIRSSNSLLKDAGQRVSIDKHLDSFIELTKPLEWMHTPLDIDRMKIKTLCNTISDHYEWHGEW
ncbi:TetR/AcrR family transcriptional regulator [Ferrimonas pelagia]|uniref:TetR/AcrR family transcriptional regulator n=1 Tax=Ferrimonas pelagia TaxID=1177826 RepID=A0ABP9EK22_9GAMM